MTRPAIFAAALALALPASAQHAHHGAGGATETGQSAFAAIAEIVQILSDDPATDWSKVDIQALRDHLVDMELVTTQATVTTRTEARQVTFLVTGEGQVAEAIGRMVTAHSPMLAASTGWGVTPAATETGAQLRIDLPSDQDMTRVRALGFFGVMTIGVHHQAHHMQMALGGNPHH